MPNRRGGLGFYKLFLCKLEPIYKPYHPMCLNIRKFSYSNCSKILQTNFNPTLASMAIILEIVIVKTK